MFKYLKLIYVSSAAILLLLLGSCLKKDNVPDFTKVDPVIEFPLGGPGLALHTIAAVPTDILDTAIGLNIASPDPLKTDITVTVAEDTTIITQYNSASGTNYIPMPATYYSIESKKVTIKAGYRVGRIKLHVDFTRFTDFSKQYMLAFKIVDAQGLIISGNFGKFLQSFVVKNRYDGVYRLNMRLDGWDAYGIASGISGTYPSDIEFITVDGSSVTTNQLAPSTFAKLQPGFTGGVGFITATTSFGATTPKYTFNTTTDALASVVNTTPDDGRGRTLFLNPAITTSRFDPATRKIYAAYVMTQNGRPNQLITDTLVYLRSR